MASDLRARLDAATARLDPPLAVVDLAAWESNAADLVRRAAGHPIRVASTSVRESWERFAALHLVGNSAVVATVPTYRGEGRCF
jgi:hypothetical protein